MILVLVLILIHYHYLYLYYDILHTIYHAHVFLDYFYFYDDEPF